MTEEGEGVRLRTDGVCVATKSCELRFAACALVAANDGLESVESARLVCEAEKLDSWSASYAAATTSTANWVGAFAVAKANRTSRY